MLKIQEIEVPGYEKVIEGVDPRAGLHCFIAVHSTLLGPSLGGTRIYPYATLDTAFEDALRLSKAMTYKSAVAGAGLGGGKAVIIADPKRQKTPALLKAYAKVLDSLEGSYIAAEDVGTNTDDMAFLAKFSPYVAAKPFSFTSSGDPSRFTAWGVMLGMQAAAQFLWGSPSLKNKKIAILGLGNVGAKLANLLFWQGADLIVSDLEKEQTEHVAYLYGAKAIATDAFLSTSCDILSPCAMGGIITPKSIKAIKAPVVAGSANNQLQDPTCGKLLFDKGILYAPDYIINAGGIINVSSEFDKEGYNAKDARDKIKIYETLLSVFEQSRIEKMPTDQIADNMALYNLSHKIGQRSYKIKFHRAT